MPEEEEEAEDEENAEAEEAAAAMDARKDGEDVVESDVGMDTTITGSVVRRPSLRSAGSDGPAPQAQTVFGTVRASGG